jgi:DNA-directed RNA polymerase subunit L
MSIIDFKTDENIATFTFQGHLSQANAIRRTIINDIDTWVFITSPNEKNKSTFHTNTTRLNNELLKQRLSCIPIHAKYKGPDLSKCYIEVNVENTSDTILQVTTKDFVIKNKETNEPEDLQDEIFPPFRPDDGKSYYIKFITLHPRISNEIPGEKIHFTCEFSVGNVRMNSMFNSVSNCSFGNSVDKEQCNYILEKKRDEWALTMTKKEIEREEANWYLLEAKRVFKPDSFDFTIETVGVFTNKEILYNACEFIVELLKEIAILFENNDDVTIKKSLSTIQNSWDIIFLDDYTIGKLLEHSFNKLDVTYCGYIKLHPHDEESTLRVAFQKDVQEEDVLQMLIKAIEENIELFVTLGNSIL